MLGYIRRKLDQRIADAVTQAAEQQTDEIQALRAEVRQLRTDAAGREAEQERALVRRLTEERRVHDAGVQGLLQAVAGVRSSIPTLPELRPDPRLDLHSEEIREIVDTVQYLLDAPIPEPIVIKAPAPKVGQVLPHYPHGWVRPLGAS
jgi:hypothetical protein